MERDWLLLVLMVVLSAWIPWQWLRGEIDMPGWQVRRTEEPRFFYLMAAVELLVLAAGWWAVLRSWG